MSIGIPPSAFTAVKKLVSSVVPPDSVDFKVLVAWIDERPNITPISRFSAMLFLCASLPAHTTRLVSHV